jgi:hypothetical protein
MSGIRKLSPARTPPPGGLLRLQGAIATRRPREQFAWRWLATVASLVLLALLLPLWMSRRDDSLDNALRQALANRSPGDMVQVRDGAALAVPSGHPNVRIYLVQSLPSAEVAKEPSSPP